MSLCKIYIPAGALGLGIGWEDAVHAMEQNVDAIAVDAGSTDSGPFYLGKGTTKYARSAIKSDMRMILENGVRKNIPVIIGSCGTSGTNSGVDLYEEIAQEILAEADLKTKIAKIYTQQDPKMLKEKFKKNEIRALDGAPAIDADTFETCSNIVALAGVEPFIEALNQGAGLVLCGRATDTGIIASLPLIRGVDPGVAWHVAKIVECGPLCTDTATNGGVIVEFDKDSAVIQASASDNTCSVYSIAAHLLYENADPIVMVEPGCIIDTGTAKYEQLEGGKVRVSGAKYTKTPYTMKLEGARLAGYQTITLVGVRDRQIMEQPEEWIKRVEEFTATRLQRAKINISDISYSLKPYGWNATYGGSVPKGYVPNELGFLLTVTADTQESATQLAKAFNPALLHCPFDPDLPLPSFAFPFSPAEIERGPIYEFVLNHVMTVEDPLAYVKIEYKG
ncbi:MAG: acyclic terpene utilization AtuA family protein [Bacillota bacterium]|nr:acyclic terpene utilization AtuA family protein [Bacillota bacterium]